MWRKSDSSRMTGMPCLVCCNGRHRTRAGQAACRARPTIITPCLHLHPANPIYLLACPACTCTRRARTRLLVCLLSHGAEQAYICTLLRVPSCTLSDKTHFCFAPTQPGRVTWSLRTSLVRSISAILLFVPPQRRLTPSS